MHYQRLTEPIKEVALAELKIATCPPVPPLPQKRLSPLFSTVPTGVPPLIVEPDSQTIGLEMQA
jgi:hypothetical protein